MYMCIYCIPKDIGQKMIGPPRWVACQRHGEELAGVTAFLVDLKRIKCRAPRAPGDFIRKNETKPTIECGDIMGCL